MRFFFKILILSLGLIASSTSFINAEQVLPKKLIIEGREAEELTVFTSQGKFKLTAELALTAEQRQMGLMHRESMPPTHGMLFDFAQPQLVSMWMKNTPLSLDMIFIARSGEVKHIAERTTPFSTNIITSQGDVSVVLEVNGGVSKLIGLKVGDTIEHRIFKK